MHKKQDQLGDWTVRILIALAILVAALPVLYFLLGPLTILFCAAFIGGRCV